MSYLASQPIDTLTDPQNILTVVGILMSAGFVVFDWFWRSRKVLAYRVQLDTPISVIPEDARDLDIQLRLERSGTEISDASLVLLRVTNGGSQHIVEADISEPLSFLFPGRDVIGVEIPETEPSAIRNMLQNNGGLRHEGNRLAVPRIPLNRKHHFKLLVLLSGSGSGVRPDGYLRGGKIQKGAGHWTGPSRGVLAAGAVTTLLIGLLAGLLVTGPKNEVRPLASCATGALDVYGSTAFAPLTDQIARSYVKACPRARISVSPRPSLQAIRNLDSAGSGKPGGAERQIAMSDGPATGGHERLEAHPVAVVIFSVVVNKATGVHSLTAGQLRDIYTGRRTNWRDFGGNNIPISVVSRGSDSGTRRVFEDKVLHRTESGVTSDDCVGPLRTGTRFIRCERPSTGELLDQVDSTRGAIGYAEFSATATHPDVQRVQIDGHDADIETAKQGLYPYWTVENFYTYGEPRTGGLAAAFLRYLDGPAAKNVLRTYGHVPCAEPQSGTLCGAPR
jgi:ABC-type phosphate transport system substrate-binding protein